MEKSLSSLIVRNGTGTGPLPLVVADELGVDWSKVRVVQAEGDEKKYGNQDTDGSFSIRMFYLAMRQAGARPNTC
jgi:isoquinoline 1-oxidoreductase beta subunit